MSGPQVEVVQQNSGPRPLDIGPLTVHEMMTRQMVEALREDLGEIRTRMNQILFAVVTAVVVQIVFTVAQWGR